MVEKGIIKQSGAYERIKIGFEELSQRFSLRLVSPHFADKTTESSSKNKYDKNGIRGLLRDLKLLWNNHRTIWKLYKEVKSDQPDFIYELASYLDYKGLIIARILRIRHFYEVNGILYISREKYYRTYFKYLAKQLERWAYLKSDYNFFVGSYGDFFKFERKNWINIENGVEKKYISFFRGESKVIADKVHFAFLGNGMNYQRPEVLINAIKSVENYDGMVLHVGGINNQDVITNLSGVIEVIDHGYLNKIELCNMMTSVHVGLIAGSPVYQSSMKLFDYGAAKCLVIAPEIYNLKNWFNDQEVLYFDGTASAMAEKIESVLKEPALIEEYGSKLFKKIDDEFTWDGIFGQIGDSIEDNL